VSALELDKYKVTSKMAVGLSPGSPSPVTVKAVRVLAHLKQHVEPKSVEGSLMLIIQPQMKASLSAFLRRFLLGMWHHPNH
jgi:hypothetical protein